MEVSDVRRRLRTAIEDAKRRSTERRARVEQATQAWDVLLEQRAVPMFHSLAQALAAEGHRFKVLTPGRAVRLSLERSAEEFIELSLDSSRDQAAVMMVSTRGRGRRMVTSERLVCEGSAIPQLTEEAIAGLLLEELVPFIER